MKAEFSSEISVNFYQITHNNLPEESTFYLEYIQKLLKSLNKFIVIWTTSEIEMSRNIMKDFMFRRIHGLLCYLSKIL
jgi:hypothetical protein